MKLLRNHFFILLSVVVLSNPCLESSASFENYLEDIEANSNGREISEDQKVLLNEAYGTGNYVSKKSSRAINASHTYFNNHRDSLKEEWVEQENTSWPYKPRKIKKVKDKRYKNNVRIDVISEQKDHHAHHVIPQSYGGPHEWWNFFPLTENQHQSVHRSGGPCSLLFPRRPT